MANKELGAPGLAEFSGQIQVDFLRELRGAEGYKRYNEMRLNSPIIGAFLFAIEQAIRYVKWNYTAETENDPRIELLEAAKENMTLSWNDHISEALTMLPFGYSIFEIVYERVDGQLLWRKFAPRGQDTVFKWLFDETGGLAGFTQVAQPEYKKIDLPIEKLVVYRTRVERGNPEGRSILRTAWIPYYFVKHLQQVEAIGAERDLAGLPVIKLPEGATTSETDSGSDAYKAAKIVRNLRNDEQAGLVLPNTWEVELLSTGGSRQFDTDKIIKRYESRMLMSVLAQFLMLGADQVGSLALSRDQTDFFNMSVNALADIISETHNKYALPRLLNLNGYDAEGVKLTHTPAGDADVTKITDMLARAGSFITWMPEDEEWLRKIGGLPEVDIEVLTQKREEEELRKQEMADAIIRGKNENTDQKESPFGKEKREAGGKEEPKKDSKKVPAKMSYAADPPDNNLRLRKERELRKAIAQSLEKQKRRVMKAAKEMRNA